jgi:hypothetical protein
MERALLFLFLCCLPGAAEAGIELKSHSYVHSPSGQVHFVFHLANYRRGLFFGSCGPSTRSLQWEYSIELTGAGPAYGTNKIEIKDSNFQMVPLDSGSIQVDQNTHKATISLKVKPGFQAMDFIGNGTFNLKTER